MMRHIYFIPLFIFTIVPTAIGQNEKETIGTNPQPSTIYSSEEQTNRSAESRTDEDKWELSSEEDVLEAANYGLQSMNDLYYITEPKLYSMGLYLEKDDPARYVAAFNEQTAEASHLARFGYAILEGATMFAKKYPEIGRGFPLSRSTQGTPLEKQCPRKGTPQCPPASLRYRTSDGSCNNLQHLWWGSAMSTMQRFLPAVYEDGIQSVRRAKNGRFLPSARGVSSHLHQDRDVPLASITHMLMQWGQFVDHDITATGQSRGFNGTVPQCCLNGGAGFQPPEFMHPQCLPIAVSPQDKFYGNRGVRCLEFVRSGPAPKEDCEFGPRDQLSQVTSFLDASTVYSSNAFQSDSLRLFRNGLLQYGKIQSRRPLLPRQDSDLCRRGSLSTSCFKAGDGRISEQPALTSLHVVFLRLHNRIATKLAALNSHWTDEKLFQETRRIVGAVVQHITYREFLPIVIGHEVMKIFGVELLSKGYYKDYDPSVNPTVANAFSTAAFRFGHSLVQHTFVRYDRDHKPIFNNVSIHEEFSNPVNLETAGSVDRLLLGLINQPSQRRDEFISEELTNHLFQTPRFHFGMDLASLNVQRGRDHGIPPYVHWREPCGLSDIASFDDLEKAMSSEAVKKFKSLYSSVDDIDLFSAGLAEKSVSGGLVGPTFACIIAQQFSNLRRGDRFWYENSARESSFTDGQLRQIRRITLAQVLCQTMDSIDTIQPFVFLIADNMRNRRLSCNDEIIGQINLEPWMEGTSTEFRSNPANTGDKTRNTNSDEDRNPIVKTQTKDEPINAKTWTSNKSSQNEQEQTKFLSSQRPKPLKANIHQQNRIVVKRPFSGHPDNFTIVVQNNAVNSPVFVNDAIYGANVNSFRETTTQAAPVQTTAQRPANYDFPQLGTAPSYSLPQSSPPRPIATSIPSSAHYVHRFDDPSNPNPLNYVFRPTNYPANNIIFDTLPPSSPRPTLYTYYTNFQEKPTTPTSNYPLMDHQNDYRPLNDKENFQVPSEQYNVPPKPSHQTAWIERPNYTGQGSFPPQYGDSLHDRPDPQVSALSPGYQVKPINQRPVSAASQQSYLENWDAIIYEVQPSKRPYNLSAPPLQSNDPTNKPVNDNNNWQNPSTYQTRPTYPTRPSYLSDSSPSYGPTNRPQEISVAPSYHQRPSKKPLIEKDVYLNPNVPSYSTEPLVRPNPLHAYQQVQEDPAQVLAYQTHSTHKPSYQGDEWSSNHSPSYDDAPFRPEIDRYSSAGSPNGQEDYAQGEKVKPKPHNPPRIVILQDFGQTVHHTGSSGYRTHNAEVSGEIPRPLMQLSQVSMEVEKPKKRGQYYFVKNVLHRYPDDFRAKSGEVQESQTDFKASFREDEASYEKTQDLSSQNEDSSNDRLVKVPTLMPNKNVNTQDMDDLDGAFSENSQTIVQANQPERTSHWLYPEKSTKLSSTSQMPEMTADTREKPRPIKIRRHAS